MGQRIRKRILVTGCGRCGTKYLSAILRALGFDVRHEHMGRDGISSWHMAVDTMEVVIGPAAGAYYFDHTFHLVRNPLTSIPSISSLSEESWKFISQYIPCSIHEPVLLRSAKYWYFWNCIVEEKADCRMRVEDRAQIIDCLQTRLGIAIDESVLQFIPGQINSRRYGKSYHRMEELLLRLQLPRWLSLPTKIFREQKPVVSLTWMELDRLDAELTRLIKRKANTYGYGE